VPRARSTSACTSRRRGRGLLTWVGRAVGAAIGLYIGFVGVEGSRRVVRPARRPFLPFMEGDPVSPEALGLAHEDVRFTTDDGVTLSGWVVPARRDTRSAVILMHGFSWHRLGELAAFVPWLSARHHVLQFDFRGHGNSSDADITLGTAERRDVAAAVRLLEGRGLGPIALMGVSMGAAVAIMAAPDLPVAAVVADAPYADLENPIANRMREMHYPMPRLGARLIVASAGLRARTRLLAPIDRVAEIAPRGLLLIGPREDRLIDHEQVLRLFAEAGEPKELYVVDGAGHPDAHTVGGHVYERRVLEFLGRHLDGEAVPVRSLPEDRARQEERRSA
jgi:alpha-beta hydrolase superfamily lysophospholipase